MDALMAAERSSALGSSRRSSGARGVAQAAVLAALVASASASTGNGMSVRDPYFHDGYRGEFDEHNLDPRSPGYVDVNYVPNEEVWWKISPCRADRSNQDQDGCQVLLWFTSFMTENGLDQLTVYEGEAPPPVDAGGAPVDADCLLDSCLAQLSGNDGADSYGEVKTTEIIGDAVHGHRTPTLIRSRSPVVWLRWQSSAAGFSYPGFAITYKTDVSTDARLASLSLYYQITATRMGLNPPVFAKEQQLYTVDMPALDDYSVEVTTAPYDGGELHPLLVTHPTIRSGEIIQPPALTVNGEVYTAGMVIKLDSELAAQPIVISIRAMDGRSYADYVVYAFPATTLGDAANDTTVLMERSVRPDPPVWSVGENSGGWINGLIEPGTMALVVGDFLNFRFTPGTELWLLDAPPQGGCPNPYDGQQVATFLESPFELELDQAGTFYFAGATRIACQSGQAMVATVIPDPGLMPNDPSTAKPITFPRIIGADFTPADKPAVTATQWDAREVPSAAGWDGFHEWFQFNAHRGEHVTIAISLGEGVFYAAANVWDTQQVMQNVASAHDGERTEWAGARTFEVNWQAPATGVYFLTVRSFIVDEMRSRGQLYGNYSLLYSSDWIDLCESWDGPTDSAGRPVASYSRVGSPCGDHGNCEAIEDEFTHKFAPQCICTYRYAGEACEHSPPAPMIIKLIGQNAIDGAVDEAEFKLAVSNAVDKVEPAMVDVTEISQRIVVSMDLPGSPEDYDRDTQNGQEARDQIAGGFASALKEKLPASCQYDAASCMVRVVAVEDYLDKHSMRKVITPDVPSVTLLNGTNATNATNATLLALNATASLAPEDTGLYWPDPSDPACHEYRCYDPDCLDEDVTAWRPYGLELNDLANETDACGGRGIALDANGGTIDWIPSGQTGIGYNQACRLQLQCPLEHIAELQLTSFEVESKDRVVLLDGHPDANEAIGSPTGLFDGLSSTAFTTQSSVLNVIYTSDGTDISAGFSADYRCVPSTAASPPPPPTYGRNCPDMVADASALGLGCDTPISGIVSGHVAGLLLQDVCLAACGMCTPYLGAAGSIVTVYIEATDDASGAIESDGFTATLAAGFNSAGDQLQMLLGNSSFTSEHIALVDTQYTTDLDFVVLIGRATAQDAAFTSAETQKWLSSTIVNSTFVDFLNQAGAVVTDAVVTKMLVDTGTEAEALALADVLNDESSRLSTLAADGQGNPVRWFSHSGAASVEAKLDGSVRLFEARQSQRDALAAAELYIAASQAGVLMRPEGQIGSSRLGSLPNYASSAHTQMASSHLATTVAIAAYIAEQAAASVLGMDLQPGEHIQDGFRTYARDITAQAHIVTPHGSGVDHSPDNRQVTRQAEHVSTTRGAAGYVGSVETQSESGYHQPADFTQSLGDPSRAAIAAAAGAAAAKLVATGANDAHPLDHLAPILSQAPSSQSFSDDPHLLSSTSRFTAQTDYWWIPDYLPGGRPPEQPDPPVITRYDDTTVSISWVAPFDWGIPIEGYVVEMRSCDVLYETQSASECDGYYGPSAYETVQPSYQGTKTQHLMRGLAPGRMYFFHVRAYNAFDQYLSPNNYGIFSYDSLAVTTWRVPDKIDPPVPHRITCAEPITSAGAILSGLDYRNTGKESYTHNVVSGDTSAERMRAKTNCTIHLTWVKPFAGAVENPLVDRAVDVQGNDLINYRIFYYATPKAPAVYPAPDSYVDQEGIEWLEIPHPMNLRTCKTDYFQPCPEGWLYSEDVQYGNQVCTQHGNTNGTGVCGSPQIFDTFERDDKTSWEEMCNATWAQSCEVATEAMIHGLEDTTEYYFRLTAVNKGGLGAIKAPYHPSLSKELDRGTVGGGQLAIYGKHTNYTTEGAGFVRNKPAKFVSQPDGEKAYVLGEGDFSDPSRYQSMQIRPGTRVLARDRHCPRWPAEQVAMEMGSLMKECVIPLPEDGFENHAEGVFRAVRRDEDDFRVLDEAGDLYEGTDVTGTAGHGDGHRDGTPIRPLRPVAGHANPEDGPLQLEGVWHYPATVVASSPGGERVHVLYDADKCVAMELVTMANGDEEMVPVDPPEFERCEDRSLTREEIYIDSLSTDIGRALHPGAVTWRVPDAPAAPVFGTVAENTVEVHWNPPHFDGNSNHEMLYADPSDTASGGVVLGYRVFMQRYDDSTGQREEWIELDVAYLGTNTTHVVTNLDPDTVYIFTVIATNIVGDSAHSQENEAPITLETPIPVGSVSQTLWPLAPEIQPRVGFLPAAKTRRLACANENMRSTLLASTNGGGTNAGFHWTLWREYVIITTTPAVWYNEEIVVEYPVEDPELIRAFYLNGENITIFENNSGVVYRNWTEYKNDTLAQASYQNETIHQELVQDFGEGGNDCCTIDIPDGDYILRLNSSNTRGNVITEDVITFARCGCMDIFNSEFDSRAKHHLPETCDSTTFEGAQKTAAEGEFIYYEQILSDSIFAVEFEILVESGSVDFYASTKAPPLLAPGKHDLVYHGLSSQKYQQVPWEYRVPFNTLMIDPKVGSKGHKHPLMDVSSSLFVGVHGVDEFSRFTIRARNVKFPEERTNLPEFEASNDMTETGRYKFYELHFTDSASDMDVKVSVQCKVGNVTLFVAKKDKYPSEWRTYTQTATTAAGGLAEVIDTWQPEEERVVFLAVRGNEGGYTLGYPNLPTTINEYIITARSYRYTAEATVMPTVPKMLPPPGEPAGPGEDQVSPDVTEKDTVTFAGGKDSAFAEREIVKRTALDSKNPEENRYPEVSMDEFNYYKIEYTDTAYAIEVTLEMTYGVVDLYANFDMPPTQARYYQRAAALYEGVTISIPFDAVGSGIGSVYLGVFGREQGSSSYNISVIELQFENATGPCEVDKTCQRAPTLVNGTWLEGIRNAQGDDGYRFFRSHVGPERTDSLGTMRRTGPGSRAENPGTDPESWGDDWAEEWVQTWVERHDDRQDFDVYATVTVQVHPPAYDWLLGMAQSGNASTQLGVAELEQIQFESEVAGGVSIYSALDFPYPSGARLRDAEAYKMGGTGLVTEASLTLPVWTDFGRTMHIGVRTAIPGALYDIKVEYSVMEKEEITTPVALDHPACPSVSVLISHAGPGVTIQVECNGHGTCVDGKCICETGFYGKDCSTVPFSQNEKAASIQFVQPGQGTVWTSVPVNLAFAVANAPPSARVRLYVDGLAYPKEQSNVLVEGTNGLGIWGLYMGRHMAQLVLETADGVPLTSGMSHFIVASPGGCAKDCSRQGVCMDAHAGQYCICNDGWVGVDCSQVDLWRSWNASKTAGGGLPGQGLASSLMRQLEENLGKGVMQTRLDLEALGRSVGKNDATVLGRKDAAEKAMDQFMLQVEAGSKQLALEHEVMLEELYRSRDRLERDSEETGSALRRTLTARSEQQAATERGLHADTKRRQNRFTRMERKEDVRFAMLDDEFEYYNHKRTHETHAVRHFEDYSDDPNAALGENGKPKPGRRTRIDELAPSDCLQDVNGMWTCFFINSAKDCESGDVMRWNSQEEATKYPVLCRNPVRGTARDQAGAASVPDSEGGGDGVGRPFSYQGDVTAPGGSADPREDDGTRPMAEGGGDLYSDGPR